MTIRSEQTLKEEMVVFLRNSDILSTSERGVTTTSDTFIATAGQTIFTLTKNVARNIRSVTVQAVSKTCYTDYTPSYGASSSTVTLLVGATVGDTVIVSYDYSAGLAERIFPDYPEIIYLVDQCPRIGFGIEMSKTDIIGIGNPNYLTDCIVTIKVYSKNLKSLDGYIYTLRNAIKTRQKGFYYFPIVYPSTISPAITVEHLNKKVFMKSIDLLMKFNYES